MSDCICLICGATFQHKHPHTKACSLTCHKEHLRRSYVRYRERVKQRRPPPRDEKFCPHCRETLPARAFVRVLCQASGLGTYCKACCRARRLRPAAREKERLQKHVWYLLHYEEHLRNGRMRYLFDQEFRARVNAANRDRHNADPATRYARSKEIRNLYRSWEHQDERRCFCGKALPAGEEEAGRWFCRPVCKIACSRFVCGLG